MRKAGPTSLLLDGRVGFQSSTELPASVLDGGLAGLSLAAAHNGPLALDAADGSLGRMVLPRGMALDRDNTLYLLDPDSGRIRKFHNPSQEVSGAFVELQDIGGVGSAPRQFRDPTDLEIVGNCLYVADAGNRRVQMLDLITGELIAIWTAEIGRSPLFSMSPQQEAWYPVCVASFESTAYILDQRLSRVYQHSPDHGWPCQLIQGPPETYGHWENIAVDRNGRIYVLEVRNDGAVLIVYNADGDREVERLPNGGSIPQTITDAAQVRDNFDPPPVVLDHRQRFCLAAELVRECPRLTPDPPPSMEDPLAACRSRPPRGLLFHRNGNRIRDYDPAEPFGPQIYRREGKWFSTILDSRLTRCRWHRIELECRPLPPGTTLTVLTYTDEVRRTDAFIRNQQRDRWEVAHRISGNVQGSSPNEGAEQPHDFLIHSDDGRYLWLCLELSGDGFATPQILSLRVHYPRQSYLDDLPAVYQQDEEGRRFLDRFLSVFQTEWDDIDGTLDEFARYFDPAAVPEQNADQFLPPLAEWTGVTRERTWSTGQQRMFLLAARKAFRTRTGANRRGTVAALRYYLQAYLQNMTGLSPEQQGPFPVIVEGFRERAYRNIGGHGAPLRTALPLWSRSVTNRLQTDVHARVGDVRLVSLGEPGLDAFREHAHRFRVFLPASWVATEEAEQMIHRAIDREKPAHTCCELMSVSAGVQIGVQSTIGTDMILGCREPVILAGEDSQASVHAPYARLGVDSLLGTKPSDEPCRNAADAPILGINSILHNAQELNQ